MDGLVVTEGVGRDGDVATVVVWLS